LFKQTCCSNDSCNVCPIINDVKPHNTTDWLLLLITLCTGWYNGGDFELGIGLYGFILKQTRQNICPNHYNRLVCKIDHTYRECCLSADMRNFFIITFIISRVCSKNQNFFTKLRYVTFLYYRIFPWIDIILQSIKKANNSNFNNSYQSYILKYSLNTWLTFRGVFKNKSVPMLCVLFRAYIMFASFAITVRFKWQFILYFTLKIKKQA